MRRPNLFRTTTATLTGVAYLSFTALVAGGGCVSNEYRISRDELRRLAQTPLETRGTDVRVLQDVGSRRGPEITPPTEQELRQAWEPVYDDQIPLSDPAEGGDDGAVGDIHLDLNSGTRPRTGVHARGLHPHLTGTSGNVGPSPGGGLVRGGPVGGGSHSHGGGGSGNFFSGGGGGGGGGGGDAAAALVVVAVLAVVVAAGVAIGLVASEGTRFQGKAAIAPRQTIYIDHDNGQLSEVELERLSAADLVHATGAVVKDDEGWGVVQGPRDRLDRRGGAFGLELGAAAFNLGGARGVGPAAEIQVGGFFRPRWGLMLDVGVSGGELALGGVGSAAATAADANTLVTRHHLALELQAYPASLGPLHFGLFGRAGGALVGSSAGVQGGPLAGGGVLVQVELTSRLALVLRGGLDTAHMNGSWSTAGVATAGVAIY